MNELPKKPNYAAWPKQKIQITDLFLDPENIRLEVPVNAAPDVLLNDLFVNENAMQVLESIAASGFFPDELPVVIKEKNKFVVIEGNRRIAALKVLARPELMPSKASIVKKILKTAVTIPTMVEVVVAPSREEVSHFLASKHTQNIKRPWRPLRQAYFYKAELERGKTVEQLRNAYPTVDISRFLRMINVHKIAKSIQYDNSSVADKVHSAKTFPASTIERLYDDKNVRDFLGFDFDGKGDVRISIQKQEFEKGFKKIVQDVVEKTVDSRSLNNEESRRKYLTSFQKTDRPDKKRTGEVITSGDFKEIAPSLGPKTRTHLAPKNIIFSLKSPGVKRMFEELQKISYRKFPNATHDLLRSFLECSLKAYFSECGVAVGTSGNHIGLSTVLKKFKEEMDNEKNKELSQLTQKVISDNSMTSYSASFLDAINHNPSFFATPKNVEEAWDTMENIFRYILNPKHKQSPNAKNHP